MIGSAVLTLLFLACAGAWEEGKGDGEVFQSLGELAEGLPRYGWVGSKSKAGTLYMLVHCPGDME